MRQERARLSRHNNVAQAMDYMLKRWPAFTRFLNDGRICVSNNAAERALRGIALGRRAWLFAGSDRGGDRAAFMYSLIVTAKMNDIDPQAWLADVLRRINDHPAARLDELLPWNWGAPLAETAAAQPRFQFAGGDARCRPGMRRMLPSAKHGPAMLDTCRRRAMNCRHFGQPEPAFERYRSTALVVGLICPPL